MIRGFAAWEYIPPGGRLYYLHMLEKLHEDLQLIVFRKKQAAEAHGWACC